MTAKSRLVRTCIFSIAVTISPSGAVVDQSGATYGYGKDLNDHAVRHLANSGDRVVVLIFAATDCPISNRYIPEVSRIEEELTPRGVAFWWVFPNPDDTASKVRQHELDYSSHSATLVDTHQGLVRMAHVAVTPEAAVFKVSDGKLTEVYHGRIDDRYESFGHERPQATTHDLEDAIRSTLAGSSVVHPVTNPVGCSIVPLATKP